MSEKAGRHAEEVSQLVKQNRKEWISVSDQIWDFAEICFEERRSAGLLASVFEKHGFEVERGIGGLETAFMATWGKGEPIIGFLGEYDALTRLSQKAGVAQPDPVVEGGHGHGCGHNLLGTASAAGALAARDWLAAHKIPGTVRYYGCPAEENSGGKVIMVEAGLFRELSAALAWHPGDAYFVQSCSNLATCLLEFKFYGKSVHASLEPHMGRSALDAVELMNVGANYLREHLPPESKLHYAITNAGGASPNVVPAEASVVYQFRAPKKRQVDEIYPRLCDIAKGAALMTGTRVEFKERVRYLNTIPNTTIEKIAHANLEKLGVPRPDKEDLDFAQKIRATLDQSSNGLNGPDLAEDYRPYQPHGPRGKASTDVGNVSWVTPTIQYRSATWAIGTPAHSWQAVAQGKTRYAHEAMLHAGAILGATAVDLFLNPEILREAREELRRALEAENV